MVTRIQVRPGTRVAMSLVRLDLNVIGYVDVVYACAAVLPFMSAVLVLVGVGGAFSCVAHMRRELERVDGGVLAVAPFPPVERAPRALRRRRANVERVLQNGADCDSRILRLAAVVVSCEDDWRTLRRKLAHPANHEQHPLLAREFADVVGVRVGESKRRAALAVLQQRP